MDECRSFHCPLRARQASEVCAKWRDHKTRREQHWGGFCYFLQGGRGGADLGRVDRSVVIDCFQLLCPDLSQLVFPDLSSCSVDDNYSSNLRVEATCRGKFD